MATITSAASGNWSAGATWVGGVVPTSVDDVVIANHTIQADVDINVLSISRNGGGTVVVSTSRTITCTGAGITTAGSISSALINITAAFGNSVTINSNAHNNNGSGGNIAILVNGAATVSIFGNITSNGNFNSTSLSILTTNSNVNITGNITGPSTSTGNTWTIQIIGVGSILSITGNVIPSAQRAITTSVSSTINIIGNTSSNALSNAVSSTSLVRLGGTITNFGGILAISAGSYQIYSTIPTQWLFQTENALVNKTLYDVQSLPTIPVIGDVRDGIVYADGALTGTLVVPTADTVTKGVVYDNGTIGTAENTSATFLAELAASTDPLAERLRSVSTVQTTGDQIAAAL